MRKFLLIFIVLLTTGCYEFLSPVYYDREYIVRIESDTYWEGNIDGASVYGFGTRSYIVYGPACWNIYKTTYSGLLRSFASYRDYYQGGNFPLWQDRATTSPYGSVRGCI